MRRQSFVGCGLHSSLARWWFQPGLSDAEDTLIAPHIPKFMGERAETGGRRMTSLVRERCSGDRSTLVMLICIVIAAGCARQTCPESRVMDRLVLCSTDASDRVYLVVDSDGNLYAQVISRASSAVRPSIEFEYQGHAWDVVEDGVEYGTPYGRVFYNAQIIPGDELARDLLCGHGQRGTATVRMGELESTVTSTWLCRAFRQLDERPR